MKITKIECPYCGKQIKLDDLLLKQFEEAIRESVEKESHLKLREKEKLIIDLKSQLTETLRKAEQGSVQRQGEVQELEIINVLRELYPHDDITQSKKGTNAADVMHVVKMQNGTICGRLYIESKLRS